MNTKLALLSLVCLLTAPLWAQPSQEEGEKVDYSVFSLEELFRVDVITASKQKEPLWDAPGVVSILTRQEIEKFGANNLWDLLERLPGVQKNFSGGVISSSIRGGEAVNFAHILMLIDGRPLRTANGNISIYNAYLAFPISIIERIELVRGPGSTLYGTNAFEGVINIITRQAKQDTLETSIRTGSFNTLGGDAYVRYHKGKVALDVGVHYLDTDGWTFESYTDFGGTATNSEGQRELFSKDVFEDNKGVRANLRYGDFTMSVYSGNTKHFAEVLYNKTDEFSWHSSVALYNIGYVKEFNNTWRIEINATKNVEAFDWKYSNIEQPALALRSDDDLVEVTLFGKLSNQFNFMLGGVYQHWDGYNPAGLLAPEIDFRKEDHQGAYGQFTYRPNRFLKFIAGAQFNKPENASGDTVPRTGAIINFSPRLGAKLLFGEAFRSPIPLDRFINTPGVQLGDPGLVSETISTTSLQLFYQGEREQVIGTYFKSTEKNLIRALPPTEEDYPVFHEHYPELSLDDFLAYLTVSKNQGELRVNGFEIESKYIPSPNLIFTTAFTYQENEDSLGKKGTTLAPSYLFKVGAGYSSKTFSASLFEIHYDNFKDNIINKPDRLELNEKSKPFDVATANASYQFPYKRADLSLELYIYNLLDDDAYIHELPYDARNTIPAIAERSFYVTLKLRR